MGLAEVDGGIERLVQAKSNRADRTPKFTVTSGWRARKSGMRGISQRVPKVGRMAGFQHSARARQRDRLLGGVGEVAERMAHLGGVHTAHIGEQHPLPACG